MIWQLEDQKKYRKEIEKVVFKPPFSEQEVTNAIGKLKSKKAGGVDNIVNELTE